MKMTDAHRCLEQKREQINRALDNLLPLSGPDAAVCEAMRYCVEAGGKRLRPLLTLAAAETLGAAAEEVVPVACAVELVHTYSLIHDDLPAMDDSDLRRGKPTCHRAFGEATAVLAGDALLTLAFELLARFGLTAGRESAALQIIAELADSAGVNGMIGGQALDLAAEGTVPEPGQIEQIYRLKTGALLRAAVRAGAIAAGASPEQLEALSRYGSSIGMAFQIVDDLLDREGTAAELGKQPGSDQDRSKATYPAVLGDTAARQRAEQLYREAIACLDSLHHPAPILRDLAARLIYRNK